MLARILEKLLSIMEGGVEENGYDFGQIRNFKFIKLTTLVRDAEQLVRNIDKYRPSERELLASFEMLVGILAMVTHMDRHKAGRYLMLP